MSRLLRHSHVEMLKSAAIPADFARVNRKRAGQTASSQTAQVVHSRDRQLGPRARSGGRRPGSWRHLDQTSHECRLQPLRSVSASLHGISSSHGTTRCGATLIEAWRLAALLVHDHRALSRCGGGPQPRERPVKTAAHEPIASPPKGKAPTVSQRYQSETRATTQECFLLYFT